MNEKLNEILELIDNDKLKKARELLSELEKDNRDNPKINYLLGLTYYNDYKAPKSKAKKYFTKVINSKEPLEGAFIKLAHIYSNEGRKNHSIRILKKGLEIFPKSVEIYETLLWYTDIEERDQIFKEIDNKSLDSIYIKFFRFITYYMQEKYEKALEINIAVKDFQGRIAIDIIKAYCYFETKKIKEAKKIFKKLIEDDIDYFLNYAPYFGLILCSLEEENIEQAIKTLNDIPLEEHIYPDVIEGRIFPLYFDFEKYFLGALSGLEKKVKDKKIIGHIRGLRGIYTYNKEEEKIKSKTIKDLEYANKIYPHNKEFCDNLMWFYKSSNKAFKAYKTVIQYIENESEENFNYLFDDFFNSADKKSFERIITDFENKLSGEDYFGKSKIVKTIFNPIVRKLHINGDFKRLVELSKFFPKRLLKLSDVLFEIAYAYAEIKEPQQAEEYYNLCLKKNGKSSAVLNNLGVIYEELEQLNKARDFFQQAIELDPQNSLASKNLKRVSKSIETQEKERIALKKAAENFEEENVWIKSKIMNFSKHREYKGLIICPYRLLPKFFSVTQHKAKDMLDSFLDKKYILRISNHNLDTSSNVYKINPEIEKLLKKIEKEIKKDKELLSIAENMNSKNLENIGYDKSLVSALNKISSKELRKMLKRDLYENAIALITKSYKTSLIMSGSIIEAILLDIISSKNIKDYKLENGKKKNTAVMSLYELLYVANCEKIIDNSLYHLSHALRSFRNLIHPGVEKRKKALKVNGSNARMAWDITKKIILEI